MMKIGITGGIGSGKSTVCRLFAARGIAVYDSDKQAKRLMVEVLREQIMARFGTQTFRDGTLDRSYLSEVVFNDPQALTDLNALVHPAVRSDFNRWCETQTGEYVILESALLFEAELEQLVDKTLAVLTPQELRLERTCARDHTNREAVLKRMAAQLSDDELLTRADYTLVNIFEEDLEPNVTKLDRIFRHDAKNQ
ncbi:MAG: dephospho-CoA kinase [Alistipes sp.]